MMTIDRSTQAERILLALIRISIGWVFLWASIHHFGNNAYVGNFLSGTKTFHFLYGPLAQSSFLPVVAFLVEYGHMLIGLSLISGLFVRASAPFAILIMVTYWTAHMDFPYIDNVNDFMIDYHLIYALALGVLILRRAGHYYGLDGLVARLPVYEQNKALHWLAA
ncbi:DoxX family protein [Allorhizobium sp. BGMRC 0089]|uniref:DoxX family protein n=1 Tax=Allorhizobium sonneratiae TaxID=2934936 RepID=UPI0020344042|nr:DoxX family protein [Allorhizobium sonneratiae]MCM2293493.1 DoxX family protein [Allorhizobium sonneratiae]